MQIQGARDSHSRAPFYADSARGVSRQSLGGRQGAGPLGIVPRLRLLSESPANHLSANVGPGSHLGFVHREIYARGSGADAAKNLPLGAAPPKLLAAGLPSGT